jgi:predicted anti-sigma-YlaC factor YlaD
MVPKGADPCARVRPHFSEHLDGEKLPFFTSLLVRCHLAICPPCRRLNRSLSATREALGALRDAGDDAVLAEESERPGEGL